MKKGFVFSLLITLLLGFFMLTAQYYLLDRPERSISTTFKVTKELVTGGVAADMATDFPAVHRGAHMVVTESMPSSGLDTGVTLWSGFLTIYENSTFHNVSIDTTNSSTLSTKLWLAGNGTDYVRDGSSFSLSHTGGYLLVNDTMDLSLNYSSCSLDAGGSVETRIILGPFDTGVKYTTPGSSYSCFVNFTTGDEVSITINTANTLSIDYSGFSGNYTQRIGFDGPENLYVVFDKYNVTLGATQGWTEEFPGTKKYGVVGGMNFVVADIDNDTNYDYAFADVGADTLFNSTDDRWYLKEGTVGLGGKVFYIRFDLAGNWLVLYNALGVSSLNSWRGVVL
ncbi:hypothetical protein ACFLQ2_01375 [archaeon]